MTSVFFDIIQQVKQHGFVYLEQFNPDLSLTQIANDLGKTIETSGIPAIQRITPHAQTAAPKNLYSGIYGLEAFPLHTDLAHWHIPPHYLILRCKTPGPDVQTTLLDFPPCLSGAPKATIRQAQFLPRSPIGGKKHLLRLSQVFETQYLFRWDELFIVPANDEAFEVSSYLLNSMSQHSPTQFVLSQQADTLIIDNWRMLHGRSAVSSNSLSRVVERVYLRELAA